MSGKTPLTDKALHFLDVDVPRLARDTGDGASSGRVLGNDLSGVRDGDDAEHNGEHRHSQRE